ncbi:MAG: hypothetical protein H6R17_4123 [Proteobacteria bacterium]|nr:hypothetical protein [Pseudomonadota bacterium]
MTALPLVQEKTVKNSEHLSLQVNQAHIVKADQVFVESGIVWLTQSGQPDDVFLFAGQSFRRQRSGKVVIQALSGNCEVSLQPTPLLPGIRRLIRALSNAPRSTLGFGLCRCDNEASRTTR